MAPSFIAYVDESGNDGYSRDGIIRPDHEWFILGGTIALADQADTQAEAIIGGLETLTNSAYHRPLHFANMKTHNAKIAYARLIGNSELTVICICVHKPSIPSNSALRTTPFLYHYCSRLLAERISWFCRDRRPKHDTNDGTLAMVFSEKKMFKYEGISDYFTKILDPNYVSPISVMPVSIHPGIIIPGQISASVHESFLGLQIADAAVSCFGSSLNSVWNERESRYLEMIERRIYRLGAAASVTSYGAKIYPNITGLPIMKEKYINKFLQIIKAA